MSIVCSCGPTWCAHMEHRPRKQARATRRGAFRLLRRLLETARGMHASRHFTVRCDGAALRRDRRHNDFRTSRRWNTGHRRRPSRFFARTSRRVPGELTPQTLSAIEAATAGRYAAPMSRRWRPVPSFGLTAALAHPAVPLASSAPPARGIDSSTRLVAAGGANSATVPARSTALGDDPIRTRPFLRHAQLMGARKERHHRLVPRAEFSFTIRGASGPARPSARR